MSTSSNRTIRTLARTRANQFRRRVILEVVLSSIALLALAALVSQIRVHRVNPQPPPPPLGANGSAGKLMWPSELVWRDTVINLQCQVLALKGELAQKSMVDKNVPLDVAALQELFEQLNSINRDLLAEKGRSSAEIEKLNRESSTLKSLHTDLTDEKSRLLAANEDVRRRCDTLFATVNELRESNRSLVAFKDQLGSENQRLGEQVSRLSANISQMAARLEKYRLSESQATITTARPVGPPETGWFSLCPAPSEADRYTKLPAVPPIESSIPPILAPAIDPSQMAPLRYP